MINSYGVTLRGAYHIQNDTVCQDAHKIIKSGRDMAVAAVADGLGSEEYSDAASKIAVEQAANYCAINIKPADSPEKIIAVIYEAFSQAQDVIEEEARLNEHGVEQYDTTLSLAVLIEDRLYYGHSGDSGIIALTTEGIYEKVTEQQRDEEGRVFPLFFRDRWIFGEYVGKVRGVLLATDGILEALFPIYIRNEEVSIYTALAQFYMDRQGVNMEESGEENTRKAMEEFLSGIPGEQINDDKTLAVLINTSVNYSRQPEEYYREPDWGELKRRQSEEWRRLAYPGLFE